MGKTTAEIFELDPKQYSRFPEENNCFMRALYDKEFNSYKKDLLTNMTQWVDSGEKGFRRLDLALYAASWTVDSHMPYAAKWFPKPSSNDYIPIEVVKRPPDDIPIKDLTKYTKRAAQFYGWELWKIFTKKLDLEKFSESHRFQRGVNKRNPKINRY